MFHSVHCPMKFRSVKMWSMHSTTGLNPACFFLRVASIASFSLMWMIIYRGSCLVPKAGTLHASQCTVSCPTVLGILIAISPLDQSSDMVSAFQILWNSWYSQSLTKRMSVFSTSAVMLSIPVALLFL